MSDEPKDSQPTKLRLSRDLKPQDEPKTETPPSMKLKRREPAQTPEDAAEDATEDKPKAPHPSEPVKPDAETAGAENQPSYDPANPFGDAIKQGEIKKTSSPPQKLRSKPAAEFDDVSGTNVEAAIDSLDQKEEDAAQNSHNLLPSIIVLLVLLLILAGAGYGLWKVLQSPTETDSGETTELPASEAEAPKKGPIQKAKDAIAKVPVADVEAITTQEAPKPPADESSADPAPTNVTVEENFTPAPPPNANSIEANKQSVAEYLSGIHIGGMRKGERPMILINGESFLVGDVVQTETGLKFDGLRDGKLAFRDSNGIVYLKSF